MPQHLYNEARKFLCKFFFFFVSGDGEGVFSSVAAELFLLERV